MTIVIPAFNEEAHIGECLRGATDLDYPAEQVEIVVVDNGSEDATAEIARQFGVTVLRQPAGFVGGVRNLGAAASASSEILAFLDADCVPPTGWLAEGVALLENDSRIGAVGGPSMARTDATWLEEAWAPPIPARAHEAPSLAASSMFLWRNVFVDVGGFNESISAGEDDDLSRRLRAEGWTLVSSPGCAVYHLGWPRTLRETYRRQVWQGSNQLRATEGQLDRNVIAVHVFAVALLSTAVALLMARGAFSIAWAVPAVIAGLIPLLASTRRSWRIERLAVRGRRIIRLYPIYVAYYVGRMVGLLSEYARMMGVRTRNEPKSWQRRRK